MSQGFGANGVWLSSDLNGAQEATRAPATGTARPQLALGKLCWRESADPKLASAVLIDGATNMSCMSRNVREIYLDGSGFQIKKASQWSAFFSIAG